LNPVATAPGSVLGEPTRGFARRVKEPFKTFTVYLADQVYRLHRANTGRSD
jgi:hypothetical protein